MRILLLYYSGAGNTKFIAKFIEKILLKENHVVKLIRITEKSINILDNDFDVLILGFPIIFRNAPELVYKSLEKLSGEKRPILIYLTKGLYSGNAFKFIHKKAVEKGFSVKGFLNLYMLGMDLFTYVISSGTFFEKIYLKVHSRSIYSKIKNFLDKIHEGKEIKKVYTKWYTFFDELVVKPLEIKADNDHKDWIKGFNTNENLCIQCMKCVDGCPRNNIEYKEKITFGYNCDVCLFCINNCPKMAINIFTKTLNKVKISEERINKIFENELRRQNVT